MGWRKLEILPSAARTATVITPVFCTPNIRALMVFVDTTSVTATPSVTCAVNMANPNPKVNSASDGVGLLTSGAITAVGNTLMQLAPGLTFAANASIGALVPGEWYITMTHADTDSITYSVNAWVFEEDT